VDGDLWSECDGDCDDDNADVNPGAEEVCDDGIDNDCDGRELDSSDSDLDGVSACDGDCDDDDPDVFPGQEEFCNNLDDDCDELVDEDALDLDLDGYDDCEDCDDDRDDVHPAAEELCDGLDGDCDGTVPADELDADGDTYLGCGGDCDDDSADVNPDGVEVCGDGIDQDCDAADLPCAGGIILGTPDELEASCASSVAGHAGPGALALLLLVGLARRRRMAPALGLLLLGCSGPVGPVSVQTWWGGQDSDEDVFFEAGGAFDAVALSSSFEADGSLWVEVALVGAEVDCVGYGNYRSRAADITVEIAAALADPDTRLGAVEDVVGLACQELDGAAREAFGWDGSYRALHLLARGDGDGSFLPSSAAPVGPVLSELPQDGFFASRYVEWGGLGAGLLPGGDGSESGYEACVGRLTNVFQAWDAGELGDVPSEAMAAWGLSGRRAEHHDPALEEVSHEEGSSSPVGVFFGGWSGPSSPGATLRVTSFVGLQDVPEGVDFARAALGVEAGSALESCPDLAGSEVAVWPEPGLVGQGDER
jgi:MYXO-CTERM domain-containing protein